MNAALFSITPTLGSSTQNRMINISSGPDSNSCYYVFNYRFLHIGAYITHEHRPDVPPASSRHGAKRHRSL